MLPQVGEVLKARDGAPTVCSRCKGDQAPGLGKYWRDRQRLGILNREGEGTSHEYCSLGWQIHTLLLPGLFELRLHPHQEYPLLCWEELSSRPSHHLLSFL